jgi:Homeodomain-like domain
MSKWQRRLARLRREARYADVVALYLQGVSIVRIAEDLHMSRTTVRKFVAAGAFPERASTLRSKSILDPYIPYLQQRLAEGPTTASQLWRDVREQGFLGGDIRGCTVVAGPRMAIAQGSFLAGAKNAGGFQAEQCSWIHSCAGA